MTPEDLAHLLQQELKARDWTIDQLADKAGVAFETARRATRSIGSISLTSTNKLLVAVDMQLSVLEVATQPEQVLASA